MKVSTIEKNIPIPTTPKPTHKGGSKKQQLTKNLEKMKPTDSFLIVGTEAKNITSYISRYKKKHSSKKQFTIRKLKPETYRLWRTK